MRPGPPTSAQPTPRESEEELEPHPEQVPRGPEVIRADDDGTPELRMLPVHVELGVEVQIPVEADVRRPGVVAVQVGVGESRGEDLLAEVERAEAAVDLEGSRRPLALGKAEVSPRLHHVHTPRELL